jgi:ribosomal protein S18 acetylase RimI-like enzyme
MNIEITGPFLGKAGICKPILRALPQWFGIEEATQQYARDTEVMPTFLAYTGDSAIGFLTMKKHGDKAAEIQVMGVLPEYHRTGTGHALVDRAEEHLRKQGVEYLQVKTLSAKHPDENYARTRAFYLAMGFVELEEFPTLWGEENPCLQLVKRLDP